MPNRRKFRLDDHTKELLVRGSVVLGLVTVTGLLSNILILVLGYIIALPHLMDYLNGYFMTLNNTFLWFLYGSLSLVFCIVLNALFMQNIGATAAHYRRNFPRAPGSADTDHLISAGGGCFVHGLLCWIVAKMGLPYLFFAGPVQYLARLIGGGRRSLFADVSYHFPAWVISLSVLIYILAVFAGCLIGCRRGYAKRMAQLDEAEREAKKRTSPEKTWSAADTEQTPFAYRNDQKQ